MTAETGASYARPARMEESADKFKVELLAFPELTRDGAADALVKAFAIDNAVQWLRDYRFDGLRLDEIGRAHV